MSRLLNDHNSIETSPLPWTSFFKPTQTLKSCSFFFLRSVGADPEHRGRGEQEDGGGRVSVLQTGSGELKNNKGQVLLLLFLSSLNSLSQFKVFATKRILNAIEGGNLEANKRSALLNRGLLA